MNFRITGREIGALVLAALPFVLWFGERSTVTVNGVVTAHHEYNYAGVILGGIAIVVSVVGLINIGRDVRDQPLLPHYAIFVIAGLVGIYQVLKGASLI